MKKTFTLFFALVASVGTMFAESGTCGDNLTWDLTNDSVLTISGTGPMTDYSYYTPWEAYNFTRIVINQGVTSIGDHAFHGCIYLTSIEIPNSVTSIGIQAFKGCRELVSIELPNSITSIGKDAFYECRNLTSVTIPNSLTCIESGTFHDCGLKSLTIGKDVTIGDCAFYNCYISEIHFNGTIKDWFDKKWNMGGLDGHWTYAYRQIHRCTLYIGNKEVTDLVVPNDVTCIPDSAFTTCGLTSVSVPNSVTSIGKDAFSRCADLNSVMIGNGVTSIGSGAFCYCSNLTSVTCYAITPPSLSSSVFYDTPRGKIPLYVPAGSVDSYKSAKQWKDFGSILPISAQDAETETTTVTTTTTENAVDITWPSVTGAATYELVIKDKEGNVICTLIFNSAGQLTSIAFYAPSRDGAPQHTQTAGFAFTVTNLEPGTEYDLTITAKNANGQEIDKKNISFHTNWPNGIEDIHIDSDKPVKVLMDGQIYILRGEHVYDTEGKMVR